jgi:hypothetical protein
VNPKLLNRVVSSAKGLEELLSLAEKHGHGFDAIHLSTCLNRCAAWVFAEVPQTTCLAHHSTHTRDDNRLSKLDERDHGRIKADPRFLELVRLAEAKLKGRPRELNEQAVANMLNGERITICCTYFCCCALSAESA